MKEKYIDAFLIGFCVAVIMWGVTKNTLGLLALIPIFIIYKLVKKSEANNSKKK